LDAAFIVVGFDGEGGVVHGVRVLLGDWFGSKMEKEKKMKKQPWAPWAGATHKHTLCAARCRSLSVTVPLRPKTTGRLLG